MTRPFKVGDLVAFKTGPTAYSGQGSPLWCPESFCKGWIYRIIYASQNKGEFIVVEVHNIFDQVPTEHRKLGATAEELELITAIEDQDGEPATSSDAQVSE